MLDANKKKTIIFVGGFSLATDGTLGGGQHACLTLLESPISSVVDWRLVDSMQRSLPVPPVYVRAVYALGRVWRTVWHLARRETDGLLIFSSFSINSLAEKGLMCLLGRFFGKRVVISLRSEIRPFRGLSSWSHPFVRAALRSCDVVMCQSPVAAAALTSFWRCDPATIAVIPNWIDLDPYSQCANQRSERRSSSGPLVVLYMGWLEERKGVNELLDAVGELVEQGKHLQVVLCGSGSLRKPLEERVLQMGLSTVVQFRGWVRDQEKFNEFGKADVFVLPSYTEGLPNALMEAMASGLPVVATPVGGGGGPYAG